MTARSSTLTRLRSPMERTGRRPDAVGRRRRLVGAGLVPVLSGWILDSPILVLVGPDAGRPGAGVSPGTAPSAPSAPVSMPQRWPSSTT